ncbi:MAG: PAS domain S-box protein [Woeseiaceae bacterium]|nr:PAS domain S-box protein [Woeseiaceae bacterium]
MEAGDYSSGLVVLSFVMAVLASFVALQFAQRISAVSGRQRLLWLVTGSLVMGAGIWTMHFIGMLAYEMKMSVTYDLMLTVYSLIVGVVASMFALFVSVRETRYPAEMPLAAIVLGCGIAGMHYVGMAAMQMPGEIQYDKGIVAASVFVAVIVAYAALRLFAWAQSIQSRRPTKPMLAAALAMGVAVCGMHYTGMAAVTFMPHEVAAAAAGPGIDLSQLAAFVTVAALVLLGTAHLTLYQEFKISVATERNRRLERKIKNRAEALREQAKELRTSRREFRQVVKQRMAAEGHAAHLGELLDESVNEFYTFDAESLQFVYVNKGAVENLGYTAEQLKEMSPIDVKPEFDRSSFLEMLRPLSDGKTDHLQFQTVHERADGSLYEVSVSLQMSTDAGRSVFVAMVQDITEQVRTQTLIREAKARYAAAIELMPDAHIIADDQGIIRTFNAAAERIFGYSYTEIIGQNVSALMPEPHRSEHDDHLERYRRGDGGTLMGVRRDEGLSAVRKDGSEFPISLLVQEFDTDHGTFFSSIIRDITDRKRVEERNRQLSTLVEQAKDHIIILDADRRVEYVNAQFEEDMGRTLDEIRGKKGAEVGLRVSEPSAFESMYEGVLQHGSWQGRLQCANADGQALDFDISASGLFDDQGTLTHFVSISRNVTDHLKLEDQLAQARKLESVGQLAAGIAHEINTPSQYVGDNTRFLKESFDDVNVMLGKLEGLMSGDVDAIATSDVRNLLDDADAEYLQEEIPRAIDQSLDGIARISKIVRAMKEFSHPATEKTLTDLNRTIESTITVASNEWKYVAEMVTDFDSNLAPVPCLPGEFNQVVLNMIVNAAHAIADVCDEAGGDRGTISVSTKRLDDWAEIRIADTGAGIPDDIRERIFDPFFTTKEVGKGTGQGLSIAHNIIVERHGGRLELESEVGKGTCFVIFLPLEEPSDATVAA